MAAAKSKNETKTSDPRTGETLSVPAAITEVAKGVVSARAVQPHPSKVDERANAEKEEKEKADAPPPRSRAELQSDIRDARAELDAVVRELERRLDLPARARTVVDDLSADPVGGARKHPAAVAATVAAIAAVGTGVALAIRAIVK
jgi:ribosome assembly protein YihI (activator of Der GTPase)